MQIPPKSGESWPILRVLRWTDSHFKDRNIENPRASAEILLAHVLGLRRIDLYLRHDQPLMPDELARFRELIRRRLCHEPVAYITGHKEFWSADLSLSPAVLIPRPDTECLVDAALACLPQTGKERRILDLGTGSGAIIVALGMERPQNRFYASDRSQDALKIAKGNAARNSLEGKIRFFCGDWFAPLKENLSGFDLILSNPPYIRSADIDGLQPEISRFEPRAALDGGPDGLAAIRQIVLNAPDYLAEEGFLIIETGFDQREQVVEIAKKCGAYDQIRYISDYGGNDRVMQMRRIPGKTACRG